MFVSEHSLIQARRLSKFARRVWLPAFLVTFCVMGLGALPVWAASSFLEPGVPVEGELTADDPLLEDGTYYDVHFLEGRQGQEVRVRLSSRDVDAYLMLTDTVGDWRASDDDSGGGTDALVVTSLPEDGVYMVVANTVFAQETGRYTLTWERPGDEGLVGLPEPTESGSGADGTRVDGTLVPGTALAGSVGPSPDHYRTYTLDVPDGVGSVVLTLQSKGDLDLFARYGRQILDWETDADFSSVTLSSSEQIVIDHSALRPGRYYIDVADLVSGSPGYTFALLATLHPEGDASEPAASSPPAEYVDGDLVPGTRVQGRVETGALARYWALEVPPGTRSVDVGLFNAEGPLDLVAAPEGEVPITPDTFPHAAQTALYNDRLRLRIDEDSARRWWIGVVSPESTPVDYELEARLDESLPPFPTYDPETDAPATPLERAIAATVQISTSLGTGSGSLVSPTGLILTNFHVVGTCVSAEPAFACGEGEPLTEPDGSPERVVVGLSDSTRGVAEQLFYARLERSLLEYDLALLRIESDLNGDPPAGPLPWVPIDAGNVSLGEDVVVIGYPGIARAVGRIPLSLTRGIVSGFTTHRGERLLIQTDATVNAGNSGGLMIRSDDALLIGVPSDVQYDTELLEKQNYARPVSLLPASWRELIEQEGGRVREP